MDGKTDQARKKCLITMLDDRAMPVATWELTNAWPSNLIIAPKGTGEVLTEEVTIVHEGAVRTK